MTPDCTTCHAPLAEGARFCRSCGAPVEVAVAPEAEPTIALPPDDTQCRSCGAELAANAHFCRVCGAERSEVGPHATAEQPTIAAEPATPVRAPAAAAPPPPAPPQQPPAASGPPASGRSRAGFVALVAALVLVFGAIGGTAAYLLVLKPDDEPASSPLADDRGFDATPYGDAGDDRDPASDDAPSSDSESGSDREPPPSSDDSGALPDVSEAEMEDEIATLLTDFHLAVVDGHPEDAWDELSIRKQRQIEREDGFAAWSKAQSSLEPHLDPSGLTVSIDSLDEASGTARVQVSGMTWSKPGASCSEWSGLTWVKYEDGAWRYDPGYSTTAARERTWEPRFAELLGGSC